MGQVNVALLRAGDTKPNPGPSPTPTPNQVCEKGGYCTLGASAVRPCASGSYNDLVGQTNRRAGCKATEPGYFAPLASIEQTPCAVGSVAPNASMGICDKCAAGTYQDEPGLLVCKACTPGHYCQEGASVALPCKQGSYSTLALNPNPNPNPNPSPNPNQARTPPLRISRARTSVRSPPPAAITLPLPLTLTLVLTLTLALTLALTLLTLP